MPSTEPMRERWASARAAVRGFAAERLSPEAADELLPRVAGEPDPPEVTPIDLPDFAALAAHYPSWLAGPQRKRNGAWYTPSELVAPTVERALQPLLNGRTTEELGALRVCDPAAGGGMFLKAALRAFERHGLPTRRAALCLSGVDVDHTAAALAALVLHEACEGEGPGLPAIAANLRAGDGLTEQEDDSFDAILTNPPWETVQGNRGDRQRVAALRPRFRHQGKGKLYTYRLFVERTYQLLRDGGRFGLVVPASLWYDRDAAPLRRLLLEQCEWEWLFGFENRRKIFAIDGRYRFAVITGRKGGHTKGVRVAFGRTDPSDWAEPSPRHVDYPAERIAMLSPRYRTFIEVEQPRDLDVLARMAANGRPLTGPEGAFRWRQGDFNMTSDRPHFTPRTDAEECGFVRGPDSIWRRGDEQLLPLYQGAMIYDLHPNCGAHRDGTGHKTTWEAPDSLEVLRPQYLVPAWAWYAGRPGRPPARIALRALSNATNERTAVACLLPDLPCGNSLGVMTPQGPVEQPVRAMAAGAALLGSLAFDWALRRRLSGTNLNGFVLADCTIPRLDPATETTLARLALCLCAVLPWHEPLWQCATEEGFADDSMLPATAEGHRAELLTEIDYVAGRAFGLDADDVAWIVADEGQRGFRRVDRALPPEWRRPHRWLSRYG